MTACHCWMPLLLFHHKVLELWGASEYTAPGSATFVHTTIIATFSAAEVSHVGFAHHSCPLDQVLVQ